MDVSTFVFGTALTALPLIAAGLLTTMVLLERRAEQMAPAPAQGRRAHARQRPRHRKSGRSRRT
jgi:hypothetical protein